MSEEHFETFQDFWPFYLGEHRSATSRRLHIAGTTAALVTFGAAVATRNWKLGLIAPLLGYGPAWVGHFIIEKNRPATFKHPLWSLAGDFKMAGLALSGQLPAELERLGLEDLSLGSVDDEWGALDVTE